MLSEVGVKFQFQGGDSALRTMDGLGSSFKGLSSHVDSHVPKIVQRFDTMAGGIDKAGKRIQAALNVAKVAIAGFVAGKALGGMADWMKGNPEADKYKDLFRFQGASDKELSAYESHMTKMRGKISGIGKGDYMAGVYGMRGIFGEDSEKNTKALESTIAMAKGMSPNTSIEQAKNMMRVFSTAYGGGKTSDETLALLQKFGAQVPELLSRTTTEATNVTSAMSHVAGLYSQLGAKSSEMLADIGAVGGQMGDRTGEFLKALKSKSGEGYGKFSAAIGKELFLQRAGVKTESDLPKPLQEFLKKSMVVTTQRRSREAGELLAKDPRLYAKALQEKLAVGEQLRKQRGFDLPHATSEAFGEQAISGLQAWTKNVTSGEHAKLTGALDAVDPAAQRTKLEESLKSFTAQYDLFIQKAEDLSGAIKKPFQALGIELMKPYGKQLDALRENWTTNTQLMEANAASFAQSFLSSFSTAFGPMTGVESTWKGITDALGSADPEKWKQLGEAWGQWAGTSLAPVAADVQSIAVGLKDILGVLGGIKTIWDWTGGMAIQGYKAYAKEVVPDIADKIDFMRAKQPMEAQRQGPLARVIPEGEALLARLFEFFKSSAKNQAGAPPTVNVETKPEIHIQIGNETIADIAVKAVEDKAKSEYAASRYGFGEQWGQ